MRPLRRSLLALPLLTAACRPSPPAAMGPGDAVVTSAGAIPVPLAGRPYALHVPAAYDAAKPAPLVVLLHGYTASGAKQEAYFGLADVADREGFLLAMPDGTRDAHGDRFWNATDACCDFGHTGVDDVAYLRALLDDVEARYRIDPARVYLVGHSNGGFMAHRAACDLAPRVAAIVSLAGAGWADASRCTPSEPVAVLEVHGDRDTWVRYEGGRSAGVAYPSAAATVAEWASRDGCRGALTTRGEPIDLAREIRGAETTKARYEGCPAGVDVELWTIAGGKHLPVLPKPGWGEAIYAFLRAHPKRPAFPGGSAGSDGAAAVDGPARAPDHRAP